MAALNLASIRKAIYDWFAASQGAGTPYAAVSGRLYAVQAPADTSWPFIIFDIVSDNSTWTFDYGIEELRVQFSMYCKDDPDGLDVEVVATALRKRFDKAALTFSGSDYACMEMRPDQGVGPFPATPGEDDKRSAYTQDYLLQVQQL